MYVYVCVYKHELMISLTGDHAMCLKEGRKAMWECLEGEKESERYFNYLYLKYKYEEDILVRL